MNDPATRSQFWRDIYVAAISAGDGNLPARAKAFDGLGDLVSFTRSEQSDAVANARRVQTPCIHKDAGGPCLLNDMVARSNWCPACQAAFDILVGKPGPE